MLPTRTAGENGRVGAPYGVRYCALGAGAVSGLLRPLHAAASERMTQHRARTRIAPPWGLGLAERWRPPYALERPSCRVQRWQRDCQADRAVHATLANLAIRPGHERCFPSGAVTVAPGLSSRATRGIAIRPIEG